jgi:DNA-binding transcriptional ArsR family regulator
MSYTLYPAAWACKAVTGLEKLVLLRLVEHAKADGSDVRPRLQSVADTCGISQRRVRMAMRVLEEANLIELMKEGDPGEKLPRVYRLNLQALTGEQYSGAEQCSGVERGEQYSGAEQNVTDPGTECHGPRNSLPGEPVNEPVNEPVIGHERENSHSRRASPNAGKDVEGKPFQVRHAGNEPRAGKSAATINPARPRTAKPAPVEYAFKGQSLNLVQRDYDALKRECPRLADFDGALRRADAYFAEKPPKGGNVFLAVKRWLLKDNERAPDPKPDLGLDEFGLPRQSRAEAIAYLNEWDRQLREWGAI